MDRQERLGAAFEKLFMTYPSFGGRSDDPRERIEFARVYFDAVEPYPVGDIEVAVANLLNGSAPGHNPSFAPPAPAVAGETRRVMNLRLESEARDRARRPALPPPDIERSPASMARVAAMTKAAAEELASIMRTEDAEASRRKQAFVSRVHARFDPQSQREMAERLGYTVGDSDIEGDMGGKAA